MDKIAYLKELLEKICRGLVDKPDNVIVEATSGRETVIFTVTTDNHEDIGKIIGKRGNTAQSIRNIITAVTASLNSQSCYEGGPIKSHMEVIEPNSPRR